LTQAMGKLGSTIASLLKGGKTVPASAIRPGQAVPQSVGPMSTNTFLFVLLIVGALLLVMAFGHKPVPD